MSSKKISIKPESRMIDGNIEYYYANVPFKTEAAAQEYIDKEILKVHLDISPEFENMSAEERKAEFDKMAKAAEQQQLTPVQ